jgi:FAD/FMN-containing dehydrogenase
MRRRQFIQGIAGLAAAAGRASVPGGVLLPAVAGRGEAQTPLSLDDLKASLDPAQARVVAPSDGDFGKLRRAYNLRTLKRPQAIVLPKTARGVASAIGWVRAHRAPFCVRGGGHSYEALSQSDGVVIDMRLIAETRLDAREGLLSAAGGATLGAAYRAAGDAGLAMTGGSCPTVGIAGNTLGGGYGFLARRFGMACDSLVSLEMVDAAGRVLTADARDNADLLWACRGGGGGSFGIVTRFQLRCHRVGQLTVFGISWQLPPARAKAVMKAWQGWAPNAPRDITSILRIASSGSGSMTLACAGQRVGGPDRLEAELRPLLEAGGQSARLRKYATTFSGSVRHFTPPDEPVFMKGKSDYVAAPMSDAGIETLMDGLRRLPAAAVTVICDAYGGAIADVPVADSAFAHRQGVLYSMQYYAPVPAGAAEARLAQIRGLYAAMRPYVSGAAYVNYPDLDLPDAAAAYWGGNLARLRQVKAAYDPDNLFRHAQSVPLP